MSRPPYPHRRHTGGETYSRCRCGDSITGEPLSSQAVVTVRPVYQPLGPAPETWGSDCPAALRERIADLEAAARADQSLRSVAAHAAGMQPASADDPEWPPRWDAIASVRISKAEAERDAALEARAKQLDIAADTQDAYTEGPDDAVRVETLRRVASIVRGGR